ncbi:hypothetical protein ACFQ3B_05435 [Stackebrandtia endophytica]|uniref:hypothetical protein n=1 Tax=Stackebrandtia endophytica TaxID=1496996 RepID=UPI00115168B7|nr:hypothetical protein [Stackebrandtia endophytica]
MTLRFDEISVAGENPPQTLHVGGGYAPVPLPTRFHVREVGVVEGLVRLVAHDGRRLSATRGQLATWSQLVSEEANPDYATQFEMEFLDRALRPASDTSDAAFTMPVEDDLFGSITPHPPSGFGQTAEIVDIRPLVGWSDSPVDLTFDAMSRDRLVEVLPGVHKVVADLRQLFDRAVDFLWESGSDDDRARLDRKTFRADFQPMGVTIYHSADFGLDLDESNKYFEDGYWPRINFRADGEPVELIVMA